LCARQVLQKRTGNFVVLCKKDKKKISCEESYLAPNFVILNTAQKS
jgi:hypothetical protein